MDHFVHRDGRLWCDRVPLEALALEVGTPVYVYAAATMRDHVRRLREAFQGLEPLVCYAVKANSNLAVLDLLRKEGCGFDIVSGGELRRVLGIDADAAKIVFSGVGKSVTEMTAGLKAGVLMFNIESAEELEVLAEVAAHVGAVAGVAIRVNPDVDPKTPRSATSWAPCANRATSWRRTGHCPPCSAATSSP